MLQRKAKTIEKNEVPPEARVRRNLSKIGLTYCDIQHISLGNMFTVTIRQP